MKFSFFSQCPGNQGNMPARGESEVPFCALNRKLLQLILDIFYLYESVDS